MGEYLKTKLQLGRQKSFGFAIRHENLYRSGNSGLSLVERVEPDGKQTSDVQTTI